MAVTKEYLLKQINNARNSEREMKACGDKHAELHFRVVAETYEEELRERFPDKRTPKDIMADLTKIGDNVVPNRLLRRS